MFRCLVHLGFNKMVKSVARSRLAGICSTVSIQKLSYVTCCSHSCRHNVCYLPTFAASTSDFPSFPLIGGSETNVAKCRWYSSSPEKWFCSGVVVTWQNNSAVSRLYKQPVKLNEIHSVPYMRIFANRLFTSSFGKRLVTNWKSPTPVYQQFRAHMRSLQDSSREAMARKRSRSEETFNRDKLQQNETESSATFPETLDEDPAKRLPRYAVGSSSTDCISQLPHADPAALRREHLLIDRKWQLSEIGEEFRHTHGLPNPQATFLEFTIATYNVLAQNLLEANSYLYDHCKSEWLFWPYRKERLLAELARYQPDILCCQEVNKKHFEDFFSPELEKLGYKGAFKKRTRSMQDGCATFYKTSVFDCEETVPIEYLKPGVSVLDRDNIALLLLLRPRLVPDTGSRLCVANTHLLFNPRRGDIKLAQLMLLFAEIDRLTYRFDETLPWGNVPVYHPILFCGDLNMEPFSQLYRFVCSGLLPVDGVTVRKLSGQERSWNRGSDRQLSASFLDRKLGISDASQYIECCRQRANAGGEGDSHAERASDNSDLEDEPDYVQGSGTLTHRLGFRSVYRHVTEYGRGQYKYIVPEVSTSHSRANCTVDYIFYSTGIADSSATLASADCVTVSTSDSSSSSEKNSCDESTADNVPSCAEPKLRVTERHTSAVDGDTSEQGIKSHDDRLRLLARLALLSDREMNEIGKLPNELISSDHLILSAKFALKVDKP